uniref:hypothetical protein n=1 Tax=Saccharothrix espanaensis TaxID=103731 RepID=UPI003F49594B
MRPPATPDPAPVACVDVVTGPPPCETGCPQRTIDGVMEGEQGGPWRVATPVTPVWVDLAVVHAPLTGTTATTGRTAARGPGVEFQGQVPGELHAWARTTGGTWLGLVSYHAPTPHVLRTVPVRHYVPRHALQQRRKGETEPPF